MTASPQPDLYQNPEIAEWLGSFEGVPEGWVQTATPMPTRPASAGGVALALERLGLLLPGLALALAAGLGGEALATFLGEAVLGFDKTPLSGLMLAIVLGLAVRNTVRLPALYEPGIRVCVKLILRVGVALLGIRLSLWALGGIGLVAAPIVVGTVLAALLLATRIGRALGLPPRLATLIAVGTGSAASAPSSPPRPPSTPRKTRSPTPPPPSPSSAWPRCSPTPCSGTRSSTAGPTSRGTSWAPRSTTRPRSPGPG